MAPTELKKIIFLIGFHWNFLKENLRIDFHGVLFYHFSTVVMNKI
jgi:hypothetical protein